MAEAALTILGLLLLLYLPGLALLPAKSARGAGLAVLETLFLRICLGFLCASFAGVLLAHLGLFSLGLLLALLLPGSLLLGLARRRRAREGGGSPGEEAPPGRWRLADLWVAGILGLCLFLASRPFECLTGGADAGVYLNSGLLLARTGGLRLDDDAFTSLNEKDRRLFTLTYEDAAGARAAESPAVRELLEQVNRGRAERFGGIFLEDGGKGPGSRPQFFPLLPVWIALFHGCGGLAGAAATNLFLGALSLLAAYCFGARALASPAAGALFSFLLAVNLAMLWFMRYPTAEVLVQLLVLGGSFLVLAGRSGPRPVVALVSWGGAALGAATLAKFFGIFLLVPLGLAWYLTAAAASPEERRQWRRFLAGLVPAALFGLAGALRFNVGYLRLHLFNTAYLRFYLAGGGLVALALLVRWLAARRISRLARRPRWTGLVLRGAAAVVVGAALYGYLIRPRPVEVGGSNNLLELGWYVSLPGLILGVAGFAHFLLGGGRGLPLRQAVHFPWLALVATLVVVSGTADMPLHIFSIRRMLPVTIPAVLFYAVFALRQLRGLRPPLGAVLGLLGAAAIAVLPFLGGGWRTVLHREQEGITEQIRDLAAAFEPGDRVIFDDFPQADFLALPLRVALGQAGALVYYGRTLEDHQRLARFLQGPPAGREGRTWLVSPRPAVFGRPPRRSLSFHWPFLETTATELPTRRREARLRLGLFSFPDRQAWRWQPERVDVGGEDFSLVEGFHGAVERRASIRRPGRRVEEGARIRLPRGTVQVSFLVGRVREEPAELLLTLGEKRLESLHPTRDFRLRTVKVSRGDGLEEETDLLLSTGPALEGGGAERPSAVAVERIELRGRFAGRRVELGENLPDGISGFGPPETFPDEIQVSYRWSGPRSRIRVPGPAVALRLVLSGGFRPARVPPPRVLIRLNGRKVRTVVPGQGFETVDIPIPPSETGLAAQVLTLESTTWVRVREGFEGERAERGVVVEGVDRVPPLTSLDRGLMRIGQGQVQEGLALVRRFARRFSGGADWRIPLGLGWAADRLGLAGRARRELKESLRLRPQDNEALAMLHRLAVRHDRALRAREESKVPEAAKAPQTPGDGGVSAIAGESGQGQQGGESPPIGGEAGEGPPARREVSRPWAAGLTGRDAGLPAVLRPSSAARRFSFRLESGGEAVLQLVARPEEPAASGEEAGGATAPAPWLHVTLDGGPPLTLELDGSGWTSYVLFAPCGFDLEHRLELTVEGERGVEVQRIQAY